MTDPSVYEARYGWNRQSLRLIAISLVFCAVTLLAMPLWARMLILVFFGGGAVLFTVSSLMRRLAVRVDTAGITLCTSPLYARKTTTVYPWPDVARVVIWQSAVSGNINRLDYVGVERRSGAPPLTGAFTGSASMSAARVIAPGIPPEVAVSGAAANGWVLDRTRLASAVAHFAPNVPVLDTTTGQYLTPAGPVS